MSEPLLRPLKPVKDVVYVSSVCLLSEPFLWQLVVVGPNTGLPQALWSMRELLSSSPLWK